MASSKAATSRAKLHVVCSSSVSLVVEGGNILCMRELRCAQSSAPEVKNERVDRFESFYLLLLVFIYSLVFISSSCFCYLVYSLNALLITW